MEYGNKVNCIDWYGRPRSGVVLSRPNKFGYLWVRIEENLLPGFSLRSRFVMKRMYGMDVTPSFESYDAWLHESACKLAA